MRRTAALLVSVLVLVAGCGGGDDDGGAAASGSGGPTEPTDATADTGGTGGPAPPDERILALGEERLLADLLALGIRPVAASANIVLDDGFVGIDPSLTEGIESVLSTVPNFELLASFDSDVVIVDQFVLDNVAREVLEGFGRVIEVPYDIEGRLAVLGEEFDRVDEAQALLDELETAIADGNELVSARPDDERTVSVATIYDGANVATWVDGPIDVPTALLDLGFTLRPGADDVDGEQNGRLYLSVEQLPVLDAPTMVTMQSEFVEGEDEAIAQVEANPLWSGLPAVQADRVVTVERLGYPGIAGQLRLVADLLDLLTA